MFRQSTIQAVSVIKMVEPPFDCNIQRKTHPNEEILNFSQVFRPIYYLARICGLMPFSIRQSALQNVYLKPRVSKMDGLWFVIFMCFYLTMVMFYGKISLPHQSTGQLNAIALGNHFLRLLIVIFGIFALTMDMLNRYKLVNILNSFTIFDRQAS